MAVEKHAVERPKAIKIARNIQMRISHKYKFVFIAVPRTGSTSVRRVLDDISDIKSTYKYLRNEANPYYHHITAAEVKYIFLQNSWDWDSYTKFCVVRNPYDRAVSLYHHRIDTVLRKAPGKSAIFNIARKIKYRHLYQKTFSQWLTDESSFEGLARSLSDFDSENDLSLMDYYVRFENLQDDFSAVAKKLGVEKLIGEITKTNDSLNRKDYREYYSHPLKDLIRKR